MQSLTRGDSGLARAADEETIDRALAWHGGDARATIATLLADCGYLRRQLAVASSVMGHGFSRGWAPALCQEAGMGEHDVTSEIADVCPGVER